jgi:hypothetical protein
VFRFINIYMYVGNARKSYIVKRREYMSEFFSLMVNFRSMPPPKKKKKTRNTVVQVYEIHIQYKPNSEKHNPIVEVISCR